MSNQFSNLSEEELIEILNRGDLSEEEFSELVEAMEAQGLRGSIMAVPDLESDEGRAAKEYIEYHQKISPIMPLGKIEEAKQALFLPVVSLETKKIALVSLAHIARPDIYEALKKYDANPDPDLKHWSAMARQECKSFLEAELLEENRINVVALKNWEIY